MTCYFPRLALKTYIKFSSRGALLAHPPASAAATWMILLQRHFAPTFRRMHLCNHSGCNVAAWALKAKTLCEAQSVYYTHHDTHTHIQWISGMEVLLVWYWMWWTEEEGEENVWIKTYFYRNRPLSLYFSLSGTEKWRWNTFLFLPPSLSRVYL